MPNIPITIGNPCIAISRPDKRLNKFLQGGVIPSFSMPKEVRSIAPHAFANIGGLQEIIFTNQDDVVEVSDDAGIAPSVKFVVPEQLMAGYRERYPERTIVSYETGYEWTIPYVEGETSTILTAAYINECLLANPDAKKASKVVVPSYFTGYAENCFDSILNYHFERVLINIAQNGETISGKKLQTVKPYSGGLQNLELHIADNIVAYLVLGIGVYDNTHCFKTINVTVGSGSTFWLGKNGYDSGDGELLYLTVTGAGSFNSPGAGAFWYTASEPLKRAYFELGGTWEGDYVSQWMDWYYFFNNRKTFLLTPNHIVFKQSMFHADSNTKIYFWAHMLIGYMTDTDKWSPYAQYMIGVLDYDGTNIPTFPNYDPSWYADEDCLVPTTVGDFIVGQRYFVKLTLSPTVTIPYNDNPTLTIAQVQSFTPAVGTSNVTGVIIPAEYTDYESGALGAIKTKFPNIEEIEWDYALYPNQDETTFNNVLSDMSQVADKVTLPNATAITSYGGGIVIQCNTIKQLTIKSYMSAHYTGFRGAELERLIVLDGPDRQYQSEYQFLDKQNLPKLVYADIGDVGVLSSFNYNQAPNGYTDFDFRFRNLKVDAVIKYDATHANTTYTHDSLIYIINNLYDYSGGEQHTLRIGSDNLAKLTPEDIALAQSKNWSVIA